MTKSDVICPYCEQDRVWRVALTARTTGQYPHAFCYECDTFWENGDIIDDQTGKTLKFYLEERGQKLDYGLIKKGSAAEPTF